MFIMSFENLFFGIVQFQKGGNIIFIFIHVIRSETVIYSYKNVEMYFICNPIITFIFSLTFILLFF